MQIETLPVWSKLARTEDVPPEVAERLPQGWRLSSHQVETYRALTEGQADVIFNTAMTGDGKSLAGQLPALLHGWAWPTLAMYPTNELIRDQEQQLDAAQRDWQTSSPFGILDGARLDEIMAEGDYRRRGDALMGELRNHEVLLTNPDIFYLVMHLFYLFRGEARDKIIGPLMQRFKQFTFDEFHIFDTPQVISVLNALLLLEEMSGPARPHSYLFQSATPDNLMRLCLDRSGLRVEEIAGTYLYSDQTPDLSRWRRILHNATLRFHPMGAEEWVEQYIDNLLLPFFQRHGAGAKGAVIVNSVAAANRLVARLKPVFAEHGLSVEPNTGFTSRARRALSYQADLLVGTSTVDVGVDFQINFLLFESRDAGSFLQRLGRLGRHDGYQREGHYYDFQEFEAHALVPPWVDEALFKGRDGAPPFLQDGGVFDRIQLSDAIRGVYPTPARFDAYTQLWGELQTIRIMSGLSHATVREQYKEARIRLGQRYEATFGIRLGAAFGRYKELKTTQPALLEEAESFRGGSYFNCCIIDETEAGADRFKVADLFQLVANAELGGLDQEAFYGATQAAGLRRSLFERQKPLAFFTMRGWRAEREDYGIFLDRDLWDWGAERFGKALVLRGIKIDAQVPGWVELNGRLSRRQIPALLCLGHHPLDLKRRLQLPLLFALYAFRSRDGIDGCIAFGRQALLLEARLRYTPLDCGGGALIL